MVSFLYTNQCWPCLVFAIGWDYQATSNVGGWIPNLIWWHKEEEHVLHTHNQPHNVYVSTNRSRAGLWQPPQLFKTSERCTSYSIIQRFVSIINRNSVTKANMVLDKLLSNRGRGKDSESCQKGEKAECCTNFFPNGLMMLNALERGISRGMRNMLQRFVFFWFLDQFSFLKK